MSAIAGIVSTAGSRDLDRVCREMACLLAHHGGKPLFLADDNRVALAQIGSQDYWPGRPAYPSKGKTSGRFLIVGDCRIDYRDELADSVGIDPEEAEQLSDVALLGCAWDRIGVAVLERLAGDYALGIWDRERQTLTLARSPVGLRPLYYSRRGSALIFASSPWPLLPGNDTDALDLDALAAMINSLGLPPGETIYRDVRMLRPGHTLDFRDGEVRIGCFWNPSLESRHSTVGDAAEELSALMARATAQRLRRASGAVASHLSAGRDSGAVTACAAAAIGEDERLIAFTGAPRIGWWKKTAAGQLADESGVAARVAALHPNVDHIVARPSGIFPLSELDRLTNLNQHPLLIASNLPWQVAISTAARDRGVSVMLNGQFGNNSISVGGSFFLPSVSTDEGVLAWVRTLGAHGISPAMVGAIAHSLPGAAVARKVGIARRRRYALAALPSFIHPSLRPALEERALALATETRFYGKPALLDRIVSRDNGQLISRLAWGIDGRDPTADRRLIEWTLRLPPSLLFSRADSRPIFERAFAGRLASATLDRPSQGYQGADWYMSFPRETFVRALIDEGHDPILDALFDRREIRRMIDQWPKGGWERPDIYRAYRIQLLTAVAVARFLKVFRERGRA